MSSEQYTRCPHCKATFQVSETQLSAAEGKVRCGACMEVFDALAYLIDSGSAPETTSEKNSPRQQKHTTIEALSEEESSDIEEDLIFEDSDEDKKEAAKNLFDESMLSDSLKDIDQTEKHAFISDTARFEEEEEEQEIDPDSWAETMLDDEPDTKEEPEAKTVIPPLTAKRDTLDEAAAVLTSKKQEAAPKPSSRPETIDFYYEEPTVYPSRGILRKLIIGVACLALAIVLLAQAAWFHYERLVQYPLAKQGFELACKHLGCSLPELSDLNAIKSSNLVVRSHPLVAKTLIIDVVLTNEATFAQEYPRLALYFSDINGKTIAQQIVPPETYLNDQELLAQPMPMNSPIHVSLEVQDPGKQAVNYKIRFFPSKGPKN